MPSSQRFSPPSAPVLGSFSSMVILPDHHSVEGL
ncbi:hypothetical protein NK6_6078 [Bradyrhizobium diazoefficiens]|uniref:Uncharacterized protein n=1 Tax=Bradyrhizobium diazoefficiens TaxID=1355477 RepID=A0A0E4BSZ6_9BRAD|nr:hypothetical protein NK6_6078 [Bradyrhizobium diazoefficiens]